MKWKEWKGGERMEGRGENEKEWKGGERMKGNGREGREAVGHIGLLGIQPGQPPLKSGG